MSVGMAAWACATGDGDGELTLSELARLLRDMRLQDVTNADILYFQVRRVVKSSLLAPSH